MSDLHLSFPGNKGLPPLAKGVDGVLIAGDTCEGLAAAVEVLRPAYPEPVEIAVVGGNHEYYSRRLSYAANLAQGREAASHHRVHLLERDVCVIGGNVRIIGGTMWTDYCLLGADLRDAAMRTAATTMNDHRRIQWNRDPWRRFRPQEARLLHIETRAFVERELAKFHPGPTVCMFHHAVTPDAVAPADRGDLISAAYASDLTSIFERGGCDLVVTGHTHHSLDVRCGRARFLSNPAARGENAQFDPALVVELPDA
jgi:hypothetical protein